MSITPFKSTCDLVLLYKLAGADMQSTSDQAFTKMLAFNEAIPVSITAMPKTGAASGTCAGGVYSGTAKGGTAFVPSGASWVTLTSSATPKVFHSFVTTGSGTVMSKSVMTTAPYLSLTTGSTAACTADLYIYGFVVS